MQPDSGAGASTFYTWEPGGKAATVQIQFDVVDRILLDVMRGFGAVPKRGAEVGGILLGTAEAANGRILVRVESFEPVPCDHASGPSYILSEDDRVAFTDSLARWGRGPDRPIYAVGYYRGHTRDGLCLAAEDLAILEEWFPDPSAIALVIKPYATRVSLAGIFFREDGIFKADSSYLEFPFRRKELGGGSSGMERLTSAARFGQQKVYSDPRVGVSGTADPAAGKVPPQPVVIQEPKFAMLSDGGGKGKGIRSGWVWIPLSFIFTLLGTVIGFQVALGMRPKQPTNIYMEAWDMALTVRKSDESLSVTWDPLAPAVRNSTRGALVIQSRDETRTIELKNSQLQSGSAIYKSVPERVIFRLEVYPRERTVVSESVEFRREQ